MGIYSASQQLLVEGLLFASFQPGAGDVGVSTTGTYLCPAISLGANGWLMNLVLSDTGIYPNKFLNDFKNQLFLLPLLLSSSHLLYYYSRKFGIEGKT